MRTCILSRKTPQSRIINFFRAISPLITRFYTGHITSDKVIFLDINGLLMINFTPEELLLYLYNETSKEQTVAIKKALEQDWTLREKLAVLKDSMQRLDVLIESPRANVVLDILSYAREQSAEQV